VKGELKLNRQGAKDAKEGVNLLASRLARLRGPRTHTVLDAKDPMKRRGRTTEVSRSVANNANQVFALSSLRPLRLCG
jgi:hypothetical protein